jgi:hypothetical protein
MLILRQEYVVAGKIGIIHDLVPFGQPAPR